MYLRQTDVFPVFFPVWPHT